jgi:hypothetical protein
MFKLEEQSRDEERCVHDDSTGDSGDSDVEDDNTAGCYISDENIMTGVTTKANAMSAKVVAIIVVMLVRM